MVAATVFCSSQPNRKKAYRSRIQTGNLFCLLALQKTRVHIWLLLESVSFVADYIMTKMRDLYTCIHFDVSEAENQSSWKHTAVLLSHAVLSETFLVLNIIIPDRD